MTDLLLDVLLDTLKLIPYLFITFLIIELLEHKLSSKNTKILAKNRKIGPLFGGIFGALPQCGFSAMASNLYSSRIITKGTLIAIFLSTSDEMLPIFISEQVSIIRILQIIGFKVIVGILIGFIVDLIFRNKEKNELNIHEMCEHDDCNCEEDGILLSSIKHTLKTTFFILIANLVIGLIIYFIGEDTLKEFLMNKNILSYFIASLIGLIPNCASSVIITEIYLADLISLGTLLSGLLTGSGIGILLLFKTNKNLKDNLTILSIIYFVGVIIGLIVDLL